MSIKRRSSGEGSFWQLPDKSWVYQITVGRKENGAPERKSFKGRTKAICRQRREGWAAGQEAVKEEAAKALAETADAQTLRMKMGHSLESETAFGPAFSGWLKLCKSPPARKPSTYASCVDTYRTYFADFSEKI